ncbi:cupin domain-containing protein [Phycicoccus flavus]|uniref:hypothetical protein n=1 Tax=Phycicoccus flavus TaxID=2502783 RepID=UPI000FEB6F41|nr:hypothetical protein [Phycicoccus flavus]NHA68600.1 hypothetical protein [Phycicoccus flavus]NHA68701.1 hypothetical protein [Phycicoccus flavus]
MPRTPTDYPLDNDGGNPDVPPKMPFLHLWTDSEGSSRITDSLMGGFAMKSIGGGADPQWLRPFPGEVSSVSFAVLPVGWVGQWHESPHPQWVVPVRGRWFIETQDGGRVEMGPGDIHFGQDQDTVEKEERRGHLSGCVGNEPCFQMLVQFAQSPVPPTRHPF